MTCNTEQMFQENTSRTFPRELIPLSRTVKMMLQESRRQSASSQMMFPMLSIPSGDSFTTSPLKKATNLSP